MIEFTSDRKKLSDQVADYLLMLINSNVYSPGEKIPSESQLALDLKVSRTTLRNALSILERSGVILCQHGVGTFVTKGYNHPVESGLERIESMLNLASRQGLKFSYKDLNVETRFGDEFICKKLNLSPSISLTYASRVIVNSDTPVAFMVDVVPFRYLTTDDFNDGLFNGSVLDLIKAKHNGLVSHSIANIQAINADEALAIKMALKPGSAMLVLEETVIDSNNLPIEFSWNYFNSKYFNFWVVRR